MAPKFVALAALLPMGRLMTSSMRVKLFEGRVYSLVALEANRLTPQLRQEHMQAYAVDAFAETLHKHGIVPKHDEGATASQRWNSGVWKSGI